MIQNKTARIEKRQAVNLREESKLVDGIHRISSSSKILHHKINKYTLNSLQNNRKITLYNKNQSCINIATT